MKKWWIILATSMFILGGCAQKESKPQNNMTPSFTTAPSAPVETNQPVAKVYKGLSLQTKVTLDEETVKGTFILGNEATEEMPLYTQNGKLIRYKIVDDTGMTIAEGIVDEKSRTTLQAKEEVQYAFEFSIREAKGSAVTIYANLLLENKNLESYVKSELETSIDVQLSNKTAYIPGKTVTYTYLKPNDEQSQKETYAYFEKGYIQKNSELTGISVYSVEEDGIYLVYNDPEKLELNEANVISKVDKTMKQKVLPIPMKKGQTWTNDNIYYSVLDTAQTVTTPAGTFTDVAEVKMESSPEVRLYYSEKNGLVEVSVVTEGGINPVQILQNTR